MLVFLFFWSKSFNLFTSYNNFVQFYFDFMSFVLQKGMKEMDLDNTPLRARQLPFLILRGRETER